MKRSKLLVNELEQRSLLTTYFWGANANSDHLFSTAANWEVENAFGFLVTSSVTPGPADTATFTSQESNQDCIVDVDTSVNGFSVIDSYAGKISLKSPLTIVNATAVGSMNVSSPSATVAGYTDPATGLVSHGAINITQSSGLKWNAGRLANVTVAVGASAGMSVTSDGTGTPTKTMSGTAINVTGRATWLAGSVNVITPSEVSSLNILSGGALNVESASGVWGQSSMGVPPYFSVRNDGTLTLHSTGTATLRGSFLNTAVVQLDSGLLELNGKAEQTSGTFTLSNNTTVIASGSPDLALRIYDGTIKGHGTVDGNLTLGYDPNLFTTPPQTGATLVAGSGSDANSLTVSKSFQAFSSSAHVKVRVADNAVSRLVIQSNGALAGFLDITDATTEPPADSSLVLVDIVGVASGTFSNRAESDQLVIQNNKFKFTYVGGSGNDVALVKVISVSGLLWLDLNHDGIRQSGEHQGQFPSTYVYLKNNSTNQVTTQLVGSDGTYSFDGVAPGSYTVQLNPNGSFVSYDPNYWMTAHVTYVNQGTDDTVDSDFTGGEWDWEFGYYYYYCMGPTITVADQSITHIDAGLYWFDYQGRYDGQNRPGVFST